jgi:predicted phosphodiesterase
MSKKKTAGSIKSDVVAIISDIHFDLHHEPTWKAFRKWHADTKPAKTIVLGDFVDLGMMSKYVQEASAPIHAIPQIKVFVRELNALAQEAKEIIVVEGNHDERWGRVIFGAAPIALKGALGLTLQDQCRFQGLSAGIKWFKEDTITKGVRCGPFILRHGHNQAGRFGGARHLAANRLTKSMGVSEVFGHHHRAQVYCQTSLGRTAVAVSNPCMTGDHEYSKDPDWQRGFTILELYGPDKCYASPFVVIMNDGHFAYNGTVYDGNV